MRRGALVSLLSKKLKEKEIILIDNFEMAKPKTREAFNIFKNLRTAGDIYNLGVKGGKTLLALVKGDAKKAVRNLPFVNFIEPRNLNVPALLQNKYLILDKAGIKELEKIYAV